MVVSENEECRSSALKSSCGNKVLGARSVLPVMGLGILCGLVRVLSQAQRQCLALNRGADLVFGCVGHERAGEAAQQHVGGRQGRRLQCQPITSGMQG